MLATRVPKRVQKSAKGAGTLVSATLVLLGLAFFVAGVIFYTAHSGGLLHATDTGIVEKKSDAVPPTERIANILGSEVVVAPTKPPKIPVPIPPPASPIKSSSVADQVALALKRHPIHRLSVKNRSHMTLEDHFVYLRDQRECEKVPIFTSMANVFSDMYWQLIENFIYTMAKFDVSACTLMVCVSDPKCMQLCAAADFPCYDFQYGAFHPGEPLPSALEQIGELKLLHLPKALARGVDVLMLDLDVGFIDSPMNIVRKLGTSKSDVFVQKDIAFVMNRSLEGWRTWYTVPQANIGIMLCRGNKKTVRMFDIAWRDYKSITKKIKHNPGKDQNKVVFAMRVARPGGQVVSPSSTGVLAKFHELPEFQFGMKWEYISAKAAVLLDKIYKFDMITTYELGGEAADRVLHDKGADAVHTTCYEQKSKVMGLKAANAFWNPKYYDPYRKTITKQLVYLNDQQLRWEVRSLLYLAMATDRAVIIPNILGNELLGDVQLFDGQALWPGFRVAYFKKGFPHPVHILEPAFYWRVRRDYAEDNSTVPAPTVVSLHTLPPTLNAVEEMLLSDSMRDIPRIVLHAPPAHSAASPPDELALRRVMRWAEDSVGRYEGSYEAETRRYGRLPNLGENKMGTRAKELTLPIVAERIMKDVRLCDQLLTPNMGNRSCFDKCK